MVAEIDGRNIECRCRVRTVERWAELLTGDVWDASATVHLQVFTEVLCSADTDEQYGPKIRWAGAERWAGVSEHDWVGAGRWARTTKSFKRFADKLRPLAWRWCDSSDEE